MQRGRHHPDLLTAQDGKWVIDTSTLAVKAECWPAFAGAARVGHFSVRTSTDFHDLVCDTAARRRAVGNTAGQLLFKAASLRASDSGLTAHWRALASDPLLWLALTIYVFEFFMWLAFLSVGAPLARRDDRLHRHPDAVMVGGRIFFDEKITRSRMLAISLIAVGVLLVGGGGQ